MWKLLCFFNGLAIGGFFAMIAVAASRRWKIYFARKYLEEVALHGVNLDDVVVEIRELIRKYLEEKLTGAGCNA